MIGQRERSIKYIDSKIRSLEEQKENLKLIPIELFYQAFPEVNFSTDSFGSFTFLFPMSFEIIETVQKFISEQFPEWKVWTDNQFVWDESKRGGRFIDYHIGNSHITVSVDFRSEVTGSTCVLNKIGTKEVPVFEMVCSEQAAEEFGIKEKGY